MTMELYDAVAKGDEFQGDMKVHLALRHECMLFAIGFVGHERTISMVGAGLSQGRGLAKSFNIGFSRCPPLEYDNLPKGSAVVVYPKPGGYHVYKEHLGYDSWHMLAIAKDKRLLFHGTGQAEAPDIALWNYLSGPEFTTPLLRHWIGPLRVAMTASKFIQPLVGFGGQAQIATVANFQLDSLVSEGVRSGELTLATDAERRIPALRSA